MPLALEVFLAVIGGIAGLIAIGKWVVPGIGKAWTHLRRERTLAVVGVPNGGEWRPGRIGGAHAGQAIADLAFTNLTEHPMQVISARLLQRPPVEGAVWLTGSLDGEGIAKQYIGPHETEFGQVVFNFSPRHLVVEGSGFAADLEVIDSHGHSHRVRRVLFRRRPKG